MIDKVLVIVVKIGMSYDIEFSICWCKVLVKNIFFDKKLFNNGILVIVVVVIIVSVVV